MDTFADVFKFFITFFIFKTILNVLFRTRFIKEKALEQEDKVTTIPEENRKEIAIDMVCDEVCQKYVEKTKAYQVVDEDKTHYFCSWECREKYIESE